jgi:hypothetical protein
VDPRSTSSHCGSENADDHRVPVLPSTASAAGKPAFSVDDAVAVLFSATLVVPHVAAPALGAVIEMVETRADMTSTVIASRLTVCLAPLEEGRASQARLRWDRCSRFRAFTIDLRMPT